MEFQMTLRLKVSRRLTPREASLLLVCLIHAVLADGVDMTAYLAMEFLFQVLTKNQDPIYLKEERARKTVMVSELILSWIRGTWINLADRERIPEEVSDMIDKTGWLPNDHTIDSWKAFYDLTKWLEVRIVPLDLTFDRVDNDTERYSGYVRGYGNDGSPVSPQRENYTFETDGDPRDDDPVRIQLDEYQQYQDIILSLEKAKASKRGKK